LRWRTRPPSFRTWRAASTSIGPPSGASVAGTKRSGYELSRTLRVRVGPGRFPPLQRVGIEKLACCNPLGLGLQMTHWSTRSLAQEAAERGLVPAIAHSTVSLILRAADLQPHRSRYWKTPTIDAAFVQSAAQVLWCYENVTNLAEKGEVLLCLDEKPNLQVLERRCPTRPMYVGRIERQEFEYIRHGTVNFVAVLVVLTGKMRGFCLDKNDSEHLCAILPKVFGAHRHARRFHLIWDGGPSHVSAETTTWLRRHYPHVRTIVTPPHASWLDQAELLLRAFSERYLKRGDWRSRQHLVEHLDASWREYNDRFAHPIAWAWTRRDLREWAARHAPGLR
jgi:hypothetical protein